MEQWSSMRCNSKVMHWPSFVRLETGWLCDWQLHLKFRKSPSSTRFFVGVSDPKQPFFEGISGVTGSNHINHTVDWKKSYTTSFLLNPFKEMGHSPYQLVIRISSIKCMCRFVLYILCSHQKYPCGTFLSSLLSEKNNKNHTLRSHTCPLQHHFFPSTSLIKALINFKVSLIDITSEISGILKLHDCYNPPKN